MNHFVKVSTLALAAVLTLNAGQIQLGGTNGLTSSYVNPVLNVTTNPTPANASSCAGASNAISTGVAGYNGCYVPPTVGTALFKAAYQTTLFENVSPAAAVPASPLSGGGAVFSRIADPHVPTTNDWITNTVSNATSSDIVVSVGVFGVDKIWTMLNDYWGATGLVNTTVQFVFDDSSNGTGGVTGPTTETVALTNGQQIRSAINSTTNVPVTCTAVYAGVGPCVAPGAAIATTLAAGAVTIGNASVTAGNVFTSEYSSIAGYNGAHQYDGSTGGNLRLDYQLFDFGSLHTNDFLVSIIIKGQLAGTQTNVGGNQSRTALSAITVNQVVPEPGTIFLSLAGLGAAAYFARRRKA